jgi:hypothetical protein
MAALLVTALFLMSSMIAMIPSTAFMAKAASPALVLSPTSGTGELRDAGLWPGSTGAYSGGTTVTVTGSGFDAEQDDISLRIALSSDAVKTTAGYSLSIYRPTMAATHANKVMADASGNFMTKFDVPQLQAGTYNVFAVYGSPEETSAPVLFTVNAGIMVLEESTQTSTGVFNSKVHILLSGFEGGETISIIPSNFLMTAPFGTTSVSQFTLAKDSTYEGGSTTGLSANTGYVGSRKGGSVSIIVFGQSSGTTLSTTFTLKPSVAVSASTLGVPMIGTDPQISIPRTASTIYLSGRNFGDEEDILANTITLTISGVSHVTQHLKVTTTTGGEFNNLAVTYFDDLPTLPATLTINSISYNLDNGNIIAPLTLLNAELNVPKPLEMSAPVAGALVVSDPSRPDFLQLSVSTITHQAGQARKLVFVYAINGAASSAWGSDWDNAGDHVTLNGITTTDSRGAGLAFIWTIPGAGTADWARGDHDLLPTGAITAAGQATITVTPYVAPTTSTPSWTLSSRGYRETFTVSGYGFEPEESVDVTIDDSSWFSVSSGDVDVGGTFSLTTDPVIKMAYGDHLATFAGSTSGNTFSRTIKSRAVVLTDGTHEPLTVNSATAGDPVVLRSATAYGVFGLKASTAYTVKIGGLTVTSFTSTSDGAVPGAVAFTAPALSAGLYLVDIVDSTGASAIFGATKYSGDQYMSRTAPSFSAPVGQGLRLTIALQLTVFPNTINPGGQVSITGAGLSTSKTYYVTLSDAASGLTGPYAGFTLAQFTTDSSGAIPAGVQITIPDVSDVTETGTTWYLHVSTSGDLADLESSGHGNVLISASFTITPTSGATGDAIAFAARGLTSGRAYNIYFGFVDKDTPGIVVGSLVASTYGKASGSFVVPAKSSGSYNIQLYDLVDANYNVINIMPMLTITGGGGGGAIGTGTFTPSAPTLLNSGGSAVSSITKNAGFFVQVTLTSNVGSSLSVYVIAQIKDSSGNVVAVGLTAADVSGGAVKAVPVAFVGLANAGTYTATIYVWSGIQNPTPLAPTNAFTFTAT